MRSPTIIACLLALTAVTGCVPVATRVTFGPLGPHAESQAGTLYATTDASSRLIFTRPMATGPIICSEPSPDLALAFGRIVNGKLIGGNGKINATAELDTAVTPSMIAMAGRSAGVVALRDGLYSACQAYANHVIGREAYALILSQYGNLLVALASAGGADAATIPVGQQTAVQGDKPAATRQGAAGDHVAEMQQQAMQALIVTCLTQPDVAQLSRDQDHNEALGLGPIK
ncbi:hypothetical protein HUK83_13215 [Endobacter medicaginis]|nr:hypothetical protein [Endobacter medicaginis]NVN31289.1 hypothetical protein [Endobacter medicaginis]